MIAESHFFCEQGGLLEHLRNSFLVRFVDELDSSLIIQLAFCFKTATCFDKAAIGGEPNGPI
jgi:hypothetical protein